jgi:subtilisin family serine protease
MPKMRHVLFLACALLAIGLCLAGSASAAPRSKGAPSVRGFGGHAGLGGLRGLGGGAGAIRNLPGMRHVSGHLPGAGVIPQVAHGGLRGGIGTQGHGGVSHDLQPHSAQRGPTGGGAGRQPFGNSPAAANGLGRNGLPRQRFPGEAGFTGVPPLSETRFVSHEMVVHVGANVAPQTLEAAARRLGLTPIGAQDLSFSGGRLVHFRTTGDVSEAIRGLETEDIVAQPNYVYDLQQDARVAALPAPMGDPNQYVPGKLHLHEAHAIASGTNVTVAVIDSLVDTSHPDLAGSVVGQFDAVTATDTPDEHGTGMTGAIAGHRRLLGVAPHARILAIHAFTPDAKHPQQATTQSIVAGIDWAIARGAKVINMSFAGPYDPMLQMALKKAHEKNVVLVAAAGNMGPQSKPLYPAADENVIAVTAVDEKDALLPQANQGPHVALAAPGVNVWEATPQASYNFTTGTSVAAAHVSGVAALILERNPSIDPAALEDALYTTARDLGPPGRDPQFGWGLVDPYRALTVLENKAVARNRRAPETTASANPRQITSAASLPNPASSNRSLPKPPPGAAELVSGAPAGPIGPATPRTTAATPAGRAPPPALATPAALQPAPASGEDAALIEKKGEACRQAGADEGVEAAEISDYVAACVSEARNACLKQAVARKVRGPERKDFINRCLQGS